MLGSTDDQKYFSGPLNLDRKSKRADTVMGTQLVLDERKFDALDMLVSLDGEILSFERIYESVWEDPSGSVSPEEALDELKDLIDEVESAGEGFMWIEYVPEAGYSFRTHWGHNWQADAPGEDIYALPDDLMALPEKPKKPERRLVAALLVGAVAAATAVVMILTSVMNDLAADAQVIDDATVPLALPDKLDIPGGMGESGFESLDEYAGEETFEETDPELVTNALLEPFLIVKPEEDEEKEDDSKKEDDPEIEDDPEPEEGAETEDEAETEEDSEIEDGS